MIVIIRIVIIKVIPHTHSRDSTLYLRPMELCVNKNALHVHTITEQNRIEPIFTRRN